MFQSNAQFFDAYRQQMAALQKEYNMKMQELSANMRSYNPYNGYTYNGFSAGQPTVQQPMQPTVSPTATTAPVTNIAPEQTTPAIPVNLQILAILGEMKALISDMKDVISKSSVTISSEASGTDSAKTTESVTNTETVNN